MKIFIKCSYTNKPLKFLKERKIKLYSQDKKKIMLSITLIIRKQQQQQHQHLNQQQP